MRKFNGARSIISTKVVEEKLSVRMNFCLAKFFPFSRLKVLLFLFRILLSMAPLSNEIASINCLDPPHLGPAVAEVGQFLSFKKMKNFKK